MIEFDIYRLELEAMQEPLALLKESLHIGNLHDEISELEARAQEPDFWENVEGAQITQTRMRQLQKRVDRFHDLEREREDLLLLCELGSEEDDVEILSEIQQGVIRFRLDFFHMGGLSQREELGLHHGHCSFLILNLGSLRLTGRNASCRDMCEPYS